MLYILLKHVYIEELSYLLALKFVWGLFNKIYVKRETWNSVGKNEQKHSQDQEKATRKYYFEKKLIKKDIRIL